MISCPHCGESYLTADTLHELEAAYRVAARAVRQSTTKEIEDLDHLAGEWLD